MLKTSILGRISRLKRDNRGVSAVEFALIAPVLIGIYFSCAEIAQGVTADRKVSLIAATLANLTAQTSAISTSDMTNIFDASSAIAQPFAASNLKLTVTCISIDANKIARVKWSATRGGTANSGTITIPSALAVPGNLILAEASYAFTPIVGYTISGTLTLSDKMYMSPRLSQPPIYGTTACT